MKLSAVVPCFNESGNITELHSRLSAACAASAGGDYEIVLVNDGSKDDTWERIARLAREDPHVVGVNLSRNHGHQLALSAGLSVCRGERVLIIDADLQDPPELLGRMMEAMDREGADVVYGQRARRDGETWFKKATASVFYRVLRFLTEVDIPLDTGDFRLMSRRALDVLLAMPEHHRFIRGMVSWIGFKQVPVRYDRGERFAGQTNYPLRKMLRFAADAITGFSVGPLRVASLAGAFFAVLALVFLVYTLYVWWAEDVVRGWTSVMTAVLLLGSVQMLFLGIIGEYLGRLFIEAKRRPLFVIQDVLRTQADAAAAGKEALVAATGEPPVLVMAGGTRSADSSSSSTRR